MPVGLDVTVPVPVPRRVTERVRSISVKVAVTLRAAVIETRHVPVPEQAPLQPANVEVAELAAAVRVTLVPCG